jgi:hypothetical protein
MMPQGFNINNFNSFIEQARDKLLCDTNCQNKKTADQLKQDYLNAQTNLITAPQQVEETQQKYVTFTQGQNAYNELQSSQIEQKAEIISSKFQEKFNEEVKKIQNQIQGYSGLLINFKNVVELYIYYKKDNILLFKELKDETSDVLTNERKTYYEDQGIDNLKFIYYYILLTIYVICVLCFLSFSLIYQTSYGWRIKFIILVSFIILPFISSYLLDFVIGIVYFIYSFVPKNVRLTL